MLPKMGNHLPTDNGRGDGGLNYAAAVALALRGDLGDSHRAIKVVMRWTGASERTAKYWFAGARGPTGEHLVSLIHHSDAVLYAILQLAGRETSMMAVNLAAIRSELIKTLQAIDELLGRA
jgi:hypothetical protein